MADVFRPDERLRITIDTVVRSEVDGILSLESATGGTLVFRPADYNATVERLAPENWPPRRDDRWTDGDGDEWVGVERHDEMPFVELVSTVGKTVPGWAEALNDNVYWLHGPLKLVSRLAAPGRPR